MSDQHWSELPAPAAGPDAPVIVPPSTLGAIAQRIADVSPAWRAVTVAPGSAPGATELPGLSRDRTRGVESIREGWLLHRGASRISENASPDLALLIGDWCYAAGLCTIADNGTLDDVAQLARLVADVSARFEEPIDALQSRWLETIEEMRHG